MGQLEFHFYHHWFDLMFLGAALLTLLAFTLRRSTSRRLRANPLRWSARSDTTADQRHTRAAQAASVRRAAAPSLLGSTPGGSSSGGLRRRSGNLTSPISGGQQQLRHGSPGASRRASREWPSRAGTNAEESARFQSPVFASTPTPTPATRPVSSDMLTESLAEGGALMSAANAAATQGPQALLTFIATQMATLQEE